MKRILALILALALALPFAACSKVSLEQQAEEKGDNITDTDKGEKPDGTDQAPNEENTQNPPENNEEPPANKLEGRITAASVYNDGYALVCINGNNNTTYCIDKKGNIVCQIDEKFAINYDISSKVVNERIMSKIIGSKAIYDITGKATYPEDVGATKFYDIALEGGYILAEKVTADYSSTKKEIGVMNLNYEWVVEPSEEIYAAIEKDLSSITAVYHSSFYRDGYIYFSESRCYLNVETGEILKSIGQNILAEEWSYSANGVFYDAKGNIMLDLSHHANIKLISAKFVNGKAPVMFHNVEAGQWFFTLVDELGNFQFEPVRIPDMLTVGKVCFDGEYLLFANHSWSVNHVQCYNVKGEQLGIYKASSGFSTDLQDGVIWLKAHNQSYYFNPDFTPLF